MVFVVHGRDLLLVKNACSYAHDGYNRTRLKI